MELEIIDISKYAPSAPIPEFDDLIKVQSKSELLSVTVNASSSKKVKNVAIIVPKLAEALTNLEDYSLKNVLLTLIKKIKTFETDAIDAIPANTPDTPEDEKIEDDEREAVLATIRAEIQMEFGDTLFSIWKMAFDPTKVEPVRCLPISDAHRLEHLKKITSFYRPIQTPGNLQQLPPLQSKPTRSN